MLRSIAELAAYGSLAVLLTAASLSPEPGSVASSAATSTRTAATIERAADSNPATVGADRGALLFATKGCVGCHMHAAFPNARMQVGPNLTGLADRAASRVPGLDAPAYVRQSLRDPGAYRVAGGYTALMPDLALTDEQIDSLSAFLLAPR
jgi:cytochrome c551/c552